MRNRFADDIDFLYLVRFLLLLLPLYYVNVLWFALITPGGRISSVVVERYLNYIEWLTKAILFSANQIVHAYGLPSFLSDYQTIAVPRGASVTLSWDCLAYGILSFWVAFVVAHRFSWQKKLVWCLTGIVAVSFLNSIRIAFLLIAMQERWKGIRYIDHHDLFNLFAYLLVFGMVCFFYTRYGKRDLLNSTCTFKESIW